MTLTEIIVDCLACLYMSLNLSKERSRRRSPKDKPPRYRGRRDNVFKQHLARYPFEELKAFAERCAADNLRKISPEQKEAARVLRSLGMHPKFEVVKEIEGRWVIIDILCEFERLIVECDGQQHRKTKDKDRWRDEKLKTIYGWRTIRKWNSWFLKPGLRERLLIEIGKL